MIFSVQKQYETAKDEAAKAQQETERLLQVVQMTQEEQNAKEKTIMDLNQYVSNIFSAKLIQKSLCMFFSISTKTKQSFEKCSGKIESTTTTTATAARREY